MTRHSPEYIASLEAENSALREMINRKPKPRRMVDILALVCGETGVARSEMLKRCGDRHIAWARHDAMRLMYEAGHSSTKIGEFFGMESSSVLYGVKMSRERESQTIQKARTMGGVMVELIEVLRNEVSDLKSEKSAMAREISILKLRIYELSRADGEISHARTAKMSDIIEKVCSDAGISRDEIMSRQRTNRIAKQRQLAMRLMHEAGHSSPKIGEFFGMDHSTVLYGINRSRERTSPAV